MRHRKLQTSRAVFVIFGLLAGAGLIPSDTRAANGASPFPPLAGRWTGEGRLGLKDSPPEVVKCRATYFLTDGKDELKQNIRCATSGGSIEVQSAIQHSAGTLTGTWKELQHNIEGDLSGQVTKNGFRIVVKGADLAANMDIAVNANKQIIEIQFFNSSLIGLSMVMTKG